MKFTLINLKDSKSVEAVNFIQLQASHFALQSWLQASYHK